MIRSGVVRPFETTFIDKADLVEALSKLIADCESPKCDICLGLQIAVQKVRGWDVQ